MSVLSRPAQQCPAPFQELLLLLPPPAAATPSFLTSSRIQCPPLPAAGPGLHPGAAAAAGGAGRAGQAQRGAAAEVGGRAGWLGLRATCPCRTAESVWSSPASPLGKLLQHKAAANYPCCMPHFLSFPPLPPRPPSTQRAALLHGAGAGEQGAGLRCRQAAGL